VLSQLRSALQSTLRLFDRRPDGQLFEILRKQLADNLIKYTWIEDKDKVSYLAPLVQSAAEKTIPVVTLNYDNSVELCADPYGSAEITVFPAGTKHAHSMKSAVYDRIVFT